MINGRNVSQSIRGLIKTINVADKLQSTNNYTARFSPHYK